MGRAYKGFSEFALYKKKGELGEAQTSMCEALARGNINQIDCNAWSNFIDQIQDLVVDVRNDVHCADCKRMDNLFKLKTEWEEKDEENPDDAGDIDYLKARIKLIEQELLTEVSSKPLLGFVNNAVLEMIYTKTYNSSWNMTFRYMTSCLKPEAMRDGYSNGVQNKKAQVKFDREHRKKCKEGFYSLSDVMDQRVCYMCMGKEPHACSLPNTKKMPDVVMAIIPGNHAKYLKIPVFIFEVLGTKKEKGKKKPKGFMQSCFPLFVYFKCQGEFLLYFYKCSTSMAFT